jgi:hypothetical protein
VASRWRSASSSEDISSHGVYFSVIGEQKQAWMQAR